MRHVIALFLGLIFATDVCRADDRTELNLTNENEKVNYSTGYQIGEAFAKQRVEPDLPALERGIRDALDKKPPQLAPEQMSQMMDGLKGKIPEGSDQSGKSKKTTAAYRQASATFLTDNAKQPGVVVLPNGVQYKVLKAGSGKMPTLKDEVKVHYRITRVDGKEIASTYVGGKPRRYPLAKAMPGLKEVLPLMAEGARWLVVLPTATAAGGREPADDLGVLIYELELLAVIPASQ